MHGCLFGGSTVFPSVSIVPIVHLASTCIPYGSLHSSPGAPSLSLCAHFPFIPNLVSHCPQNGPIIVYNSGILSMCPENCLTYKIINLLYFIEAADLGKSCVSGFPAYAVASHNSQCT